MIYGFPKTEYLDPYNISFDLKSVFARKTSEKVAYKPGLDCVLEYFFLSTIAQIISVLPKKSSKISETGGAAALMTPTVHDFHVISART